jgi:hypothetical protein
MDFSQTGRAHLLLVSDTPGQAGGAIGIITLEDIIEVNHVIPVLPPLSNLALGTHQGGDCRRNRYIRR